MQAITWFALFISAIGYHGARLLTFRHDGKGLPQETRPVTLALVVAFLAAGCLRHGTDNLGHLLITMLLSLGVLAVITWRLRKPTYLSGFLVISIMFNVLHTAVRELTGVPSATLLLPFGLWELVTLTALWVKSEKVVR